MIKTPLTNIWNMGSIPGQRTKIPHATTRNLNTTMKTEDPLALFIVMLPKADLTSHSGCLAVGE